MDKERIRDLIRRAGMRATASRIAVIEKLREAGRPMTHGELSDELVPRGFERSSIFRNLVDLTQAGLVSRSDFGDHTWRYHTGNGEDLRGLESNDARHPHFVCIDCGGVQCLDAVEVTVRAAPKRAPKAILQKNVEINFRGYCDACNAMA